MNYIPANPVVLRSPAFPVSTIINALEDDAYFNKIISEDAFREAVLFASPDLYKQLEMFVSGEIKAKDREKARISILKYLSRMSTRCTPFGTFASCYTGTISDRTRIRVENKTGKIFRFDMLYLCMLSQFAMSKQEIRTKLKYKINSTLYVLHGKVRYVSYEYQYSGRFYKIKEVKKTPILKFIISNTQKYVSCDELIEKIKSEYDADEESIRYFIDQLISDKILISEIEPFVTGGDYFEYLCSVLKDTDKDLSAFLNDLKTLLAELNSADSFNERKAVSEEINAKVNSSKIKCSSKFILQLDSVKLQSDILLSSTISEQVTESMEVLGKLVSRYSNPLMDNFIRKFVERYEEQEIPLLEALDPNIGIGYTINQDVLPTPLLDNLRIPVQNKLSSYYETPLHRILLKKLAENTNAVSEIEITDDDIAGLTANKADLPVTMAAMFKITGYNEKSNRYVLSNMHFTGSTAANMLGRFAYCHEGIKNLVLEITKNEQQAYKNAVVAEIAHVPDSRTGNILSRPTIRDYEITYLTNSLLDEEHVIPVSDLMVSIRGNSITLTSKRLKKIVVPRLTTAHNYHNSPTPAYQFLCDLQTYGMRGSLFFSWGALENSLKHFPRVSYKDVIFSAEKWKISKDEICDKSGHFIKEKFNQLVLKLGMPQYVELNIGDNNLFCDLKNPTSVQVLTKEAMKYSSFTLSEFIVCENVSKTEDEERDLMNECIMPLIRTL